MAEPLLGILDLLINKYHIEALIASFEGPDEWNFSENTSLSEVLLVAQKRTPDIVDTPRTSTVFANLWRKPSTEQESLHLGSQLLNLRIRAAQHELDSIDSSFFPLTLSGRQVGEAYTVHLAEPIFGFYQLFAQGELNRTVALLRTGSLHLRHEGAESQCQPHETEYEAQPRLNLLAAGDAGPD